MKISSLNHFKRCVRARFASTEVFDRELKKRQRQFSYNLKDGKDFDYIREETANMLLDRIDDITRQFPLALEIGSYRGNLLDGIRAKENFRGSLGGLGGIQNLVQCDIITKDASIPSLYISDSKTESDKLVTAHSLVCDEEFLPFKPATFDLVLSNLTLHWTNDIPSTLKQIRAILKPDGAFIGNMFAGNTLNELRHCFYLAEQERRGGFAPHGSPLAQTSDVAYLMQSAGFSLPTVDVDTITVCYPDVFSLMDHLVRMGEGSASLNRQFAVGKDTFLAMAAIYQGL
jgi:NADH dehydrogenase [ubiquinone] 1 alpha subcomplex assembly factor 5